MRFKSEHEKTLDWQQLQLKAEDRSIGIDGAHAYLGGGRRCRCCYCGIPTTRALGMQRQQASFRVGVSRSCG